MEVSRRIPARIDEVGERSWLYPAGLGFADVGFAGTYFASMSSENRSVDPDFSFKTG
jgi:hypothetical protein